MQDEADSGAACAATVPSWRLRLSLWLLALLMVAAGVMHSLHPEIFVPIVPPAIPWPVAAVYVSGVAEFGLGLGLVIPRLRRLAALGVCVLLVAVFPANVYHWVAGLPMGGLPPPAWYHPIRLPLQGVLIAWAYWVSRSLKVGPAAPMELAPATCSRGAVRVRRDTQAGDGVSKNGLGW